jgi:hypothetical protein
MGEEVYGTLTIYLNVPHVGMDGERHAKLCAITTERCTMAQARGLKADWKGMNPGQEWAFKWKAEQFL